MTWVADWTCWFLSPPLNIKTWLEMRGLPFTCVLVIPNYEERKVIRWVNSYRNGGMSSKKRGVTEPRGRAFIPDWPVPGDNYVSHCSSSSGCLTVKGGLDSIRFYQNIRWPPTWSFDSTCSLPFLLPFAVYAQWQAVYGPVESHTIADRVWWLSCGRAQALLQARHTVAVWKASGHDKEFSGLFIPYLIPKYHLKCL